MDNQVGWLRKSLRTDSDPWDPRGRGGDLILRKSPSDSESGLHMPRHSHAQ